MLYFLKVIYQSALKVYLSKFHKVESDISTLENNMGFLAKSKNADLIKEDIKKKIAAGKEELKQLENKIKMIDKYLNIKE